MNESALVIGASGGIGQALCEVLTERGYSVTGLSRSLDGLDLTDQQSVDRVLGGLKPSYQCIFVTTGVLAAEGHRPEKRLDEIDAATMARVFAVNAIGVALVLKHLPRLLSRDRPARAAVLTARVGSIADNRMGGWYSYRASKAAANQLVHTAAIELSRTHRLATLIALHPGTVDTPFTADYSGREKLSPRQAACRLIDVLQEMTTEQNGMFFDYAGKVVPW
ncbi:MAG: SDR family oxidoreductase [Wenzhouxiangellaceae bacterium]